MAAVTSGPIDLEKIDSLKERRVKMALSFAKKSLRQDSFPSVFPLNESVHQMKTRNPDNILNYKRLCPSVCK